MIGYVSTQCHSNHFKENKTAIHVTKSVCTFGSTSLLLGLISPGTDTGLGVEDEASRAGNHIELAVHAVEEGVADFIILMGKVTVFTGTVLRRLGFLWKYNKNTLIIN